MALKLLQPSLRPLGQFDLDDADAAAITGGEYVELTVDGTIPDGYAADVGAGPMGVVGAGVGLGAPALLNFELHSRTAGQLGGLADEGIDEYGTLFGSLIGSNTGQATSVLGGGAVVLGPETNRGSGKVTVWHGPGLFGVSGNAATLQTTSTTGLDTMAAGAPVDAEDVTGCLGSGGDGVVLGIHVGAVTDSSLVSTTNAAVGNANTVEYYAVYLLALTL